MRFFGLHRFLNYRYARKITQIVFITFVFLIFSKLASAQSPDEIYRKANLSYENEDYEKAASLYERLIEVDKISKEVFYNLGNTYFKLNKPGKAIVNYKRAKKLAPRDRDIKLNLALAENMGVDKIEKPEKGFILKAILFLYDGMSVNELSVFASVVYLIIIALLIFLIFMVERRKTILYTVGSLGILLIIVTVFLVAKIHGENFVKKAVIISNEVDVRSGPKEDYLKQFTLHEGTEVRVVEQRQNWYEIDLSKDLRGWLPKDSVEVI